MEVMKTFLKFLEHGPISTNSTGLPTLNRSRQQASCRGWSRPDPNVQLRVSDNGTVRIFGFPNKADIPSTMVVPFRNIGNNGPPLLYLRGDVPAYVSYIMGDDWRNRLQPDPNTNDGRIFSGGEVIPRPNDRALPKQTFQEGAEAVERHHCLRIRRCGAVAVRSDPDIICEETAEQNWPEHLFGWLSGGGVCILRSRLVDHSRESDEFENAVSDEMTERMIWASRAIKEASDMDALCHILQEAGGEFYSNASDCPEARKLELYD